MRGEHGNVKGEDDLERKRCIIAGQIRDDWQGARDLLTTVEDLILKCISKTNM